MRSLRRTAGRGPRPQIAVFAASVLVLGVGACSDDPPALVGYDISPAPQVGAFSLTDTSTGADVPLRADPGELLVAFIGFTNCPDACPLALAEVRTALDRLDQGAERVDVAMITVDPQRDTPEVLTEYVQQFVPDATGLRTDDPEHLDSVVQSFGGTYDSEHNHSGETLAVGHTDYTYVVDETGTVIITWTRDMTAADITADLEILLDRRPAPE